MESVHQPPPQFHHTTHVAPHHALPKRQRKVTAKKVAVIFCITLGVYLVVAAASAYAAYRGVLAGQNAAQKAGDAAANLNLRALANNVEDARQAFSFSRYSLWTLTPVRIVPSLNKRLSSTDAALAAGVQAITGLGDAIKPLADAFDVIRQAELSSAGVLTTDPSATLHNLNTTQKRAMLGALHEASIHITEAIPKIDLAVTALDQLALQDIGSPVNLSLASLRLKTAEAKIKLLDLRKVLLSVAPFAEIAPALLGYPTEKNYLIFLANNTELRPSGGFLGLVGIGTVVDAELRNFSMRDVYAYDGAALASPRPEPPAPLKKYLGSTQWFLRDANWSPDFPESAKQMAKFYDEESKFLPEGRLPKVDGIVQFDPQPIVDILRLTGPITVEGKTFTADNLVDQLEFEVELAFYFREDAKYDERKAIISAMANELIKRVQNLSFSQLGDVLTILQQNAAEGHVSLWSPEPQLQALFTARGWTGAMKPVTGDYLSVIDANLASLKTDPVVDHTIRYAIRPSENGGYIGTTTITYAHTGAFDWKTTRYRTYARLYVPSGSQLIAVRGAMQDDKIKDPGRHPGSADIYQELGRTAFGAFIAIEPRETKTLEFEYTLPASVTTLIKSGKYHLDVEKQLGTYSHGLTLDLNFAKNVKAAIPAENPKEWGDTSYRFSTDLQVDRAFDVAF